MEMATLPQYGLKMRDGALGMWRGDENDSVKHGTSSVLSILSHDTNAIRLSTYDGICGIA